MNKYQSYKQSGVEWIGEIPFEWWFSPIKYLLQNKSDSIRTGPFGSSLKSDEFLDEGVRVYNQRSVYDEDFSKSDIFVSEEKFRELKNFIVKPNDILVTSRGTIGKMMIVPKNGEIGILHPCLIRLRIENEKILPRFLWWYINHSSLFLNSVKIESNSTTIDVIYSETLSSVKIPIPSIIEQSQIINFLDKKVGLIDKLISTKERKITLLNEQRTSLINQVVTKGLNPNIKMKNSGVEWIGEIPEHWGLIKMKHKGDVIIGLSYSPENIVDEGEGTLVMRSSNVQNGKPTFLDNVYVNSNIPNKIRLIEGDILICSRNGSRNLIGKNCLITKNEVGLTFGVFMTVYRSPYYKFIYWLLNSPIFESQSGLFLTSTINQLTVSTLQNMVLPFVDDVEEQNEIIGYLNSKTKEIDDLVELEQKKIDLLKEYRQSLISEVVTGKIKVTTDE